MSFRTVLDRVKTVLGVGCFVVFYPMLINVLFDHGYAGWAWLVLAFTAWGIAVVTTVRVKRIEQRFRGTIPGVEQFTTSTQGLLYRPSRWGLFLLGGAGLVAAATATALLWFGVKGLPGSISLLLLGLLVLYTVPWSADAMACLFRGDVGILATADGIYCRMPHAHAWMPWQDITRIHPDRGGYGVSFDAPGPGVVRFGGGKDGFGGGKRWLTVLLAFFRAPGGGKSSVFVPGLAVRGDGRAVVRTLEDLRQEPDRAALLRDSLPTAG